MADSTSAPLSRKGSSQSTDALQEIRGLLAQLDDQNVNFDDVLAKVKDAVKGSTGPVEQTREQIRVLSESAEERFSTARSDLDRLNSRRLAASLE